MSINLTKFNSWLARFESKEMQATKVAIKALEVGLSWLSSPRTQALEAVIAATMPPTAPYFSAVNASVVAMETQIKSLPPGANGGLVLLHDLIADIINIIESGSANNETKPDAIITLQSVLKMVQ